MNSWMSGFRNTIVITFLLGLSQQSYALGLGFVSGDPQGITFKLSKRDRTTFDGVLSKGDEYVSLQFQYIIHKNEYFYYGFGGRTNFEIGDDDGKSDFLLKGKKDKDDDEKDGDSSDGEDIFEKPFVRDLLIRIPFGIRKTFADIEIFTELGLVMGLATQEDYETEVSFGARIHF